MVSTDIDSKLWAGRNSKPISCPSSLCKELYCAFIKQYYKLRISSQALIHVLILGFGPKNVPWPLLLSFMARNNLHCKKTWHKSLERSCPLCRLFPPVSKTWDKILKTAESLCNSRMNICLFLRVDPHSDGMVWWMGFLNQWCCSFEGSLLHLCVLDRLAALQKWVAWWATERGPSILLKMLLKTEFEMWGDHMAHVRKLFQISLNPCSLKISSRCKLVDW